MQIFTDKNTSLKYHRQRVAAEKSAGGGLLGEVCSPPQREEAQSPVGVNRNVVCWYSRPWANMVRSKDTVELQQMGFGIEIAAFPK